MRRLGSGKGGDWHGDQDRRFRLPVDVLIPSCSSRALTSSSVAESQVKKKWWQSVLFVLPTC